METKLKNQRIAELIFLCEVTRPAPAIDDIQEALKELQEHRKTVVPARGPKIPPMAQEFNVAVDLAIAEFLPIEMTSQIALARYDIKPSNYKQWVKGWNACRASITLGGKA